MPPNEPQKKNLPSSVRPVRSAQLRLIVSDGQSIVSDHKIDRRLYGSHLLEITKACCPLVETKYYDGLGEALVGIGSLKQSGADGFQYYAAVIERDTGRIVKMGLPCITTDSGEKIFPSATDLCPEHLASSARHLPSKYELAIVLRYDRGMTQDIMMTDSTTFASLDAQPSALPSQMPLQFERAEPRKREEGINQQKCVSCGGENVKKDQGFGSGEITIFCGDQETPVSFQGLSNPASAVKDTQDHYLPPVLVPLPSASSYDFSLQLPAMDGRNLRGFVPMLEQAKEIILTYVLFAIRSQERKPHSSSLQPVVSPEAPVPKGRLPSSQERFHQPLSPLVHSTSGPEAPVLKGRFSILEIDRCPETTDAIPSRRIDILSYQPKIGQMVQGLGTSHPMPVRSRHEHATQNLRFTPTRHKASDLVVPPSVVSEKIPVQFMLPAQEERQPLRKPPGLKQPPVYRSTKSAKSYYLNPSSKPFPRRRRKLCAPKPFSRVSAPSFSRPKEKFPKHGQRLLDFHTQKQPPGRRPSRNPPSSLKSNPASSKRNLSPSAAPNPVRQRRTLPPFTKTNPAFSRRVQRAPSLGARTSNRPAHRSQWKPSARRSRPSEPISERLARRRKRKRSLAEAFYLLQALARKRKRPNGRARARN